MIEQIPPLDDEIGARARSARVGNTLYFANIPEMSNKYNVLIEILSGRVKDSGQRSDPGADCASIDSGPGWLVLS